MQEASQNGGIYNMPRGSERVKKRGMVVRYGDDYDCGTWVPCDMEFAEAGEELQEYDTRQEYLAECVGGYRECEEEPYDDDCGVSVACDKGDDDSQIEWDG